MAALMARAEQLKGKKILFWHTGGQPALFGYVDALQTTNDPTCKETL